MAKNARLRSSVLTGALLLASLAALASCGSASTGSDSTGIVVSDAWAREPAPGQPNTAAYATIVNETDQEVTVTGVRSALTDRTELHESMMQNGQMSMQPRPEGFTIDPRSTFVLEPGGPHVMLIDVGAEEIGGQGFDLSFEFGDKSIDATVAVRPLDGPDSLTEMDDMTNMSDSGNMGDTTS